MPTSAKVGPKLPQVGPKFAEVADSRVQNEPWDQVEACEAAPTRQILILTPNDYHASLTGGVCKPLFDRLMGASKTDDYDAAVQIKHMPEVERG